MRSGGPQPEHCQSQTKWRNENDKPADVVHILLSRRANTIGVIHKTKVLATPNTSTPAGGLSTAGNKNGAASDPDVICPAAISTLFRVWIWAGVNISRDFFMMLKIPYQILQYKTIFSASSKTSILSRCRAKVLTIFNEKYQILYASLFCCDRVSLVNLYWFLNSMPGR